MVGETLHLHHVGAGVQVNATRTHSISNRTPCFIVETTKNLSAAIPLANFDAETGHDSGEFARDVTTTNDEKFLWQFVQMEDLIRSDTQLGPRHFGNHWAPPCRDKDRLSSFHRAIGELYLMGAIDYRALRQPLNAGIVEQPLIDRLEAVELCFKLCLERAPVERSRRDLPPVIACFLERCRIGRGENHELLRNAAADHAGSAVAILFGQRDLGAATGCHARGPHAR